MMTLLVLGIWAGSVYSMEGLKNTAIVYLVLYCIEKWYWVSEKLFDEIWVFVFTLAAFVCWAAIEINKHPEFVVDMFKTDDY